MSAGLTIRPATVADVPRLVALSCRFRAETAYRALVADDPGQHAALFTQLVEGPTSVVLVADEAGLVVGVIACVLQPHHFSGQRTASEVIWWVEPEARGAGLRLKRAAERWAAECGAVQIQMSAPATLAGARVGRLYQRRGYRPVETIYQAPVTAAMSAITVVDDVWPDFPAYRTAALAQPFRTVTAAPGVVFHGMGRPPDASLPDWIAARWPGLTPTFSALRQSPAGQPEPHYLHTDCDMGAWTAIAYLSDAPPDGDGTTFFRQRATGAIASTAATAVDAVWDDRTHWDPWYTVPARPNRLVLFPAGYYHARALAENYGSGPDARLIQIVFGTGGLSWQPRSSSAASRRA